MMLRRILAIGGVMAILVGCGSSDPQPSGTVSYSVIKEGSLGGDSSLTPPRGELVRTRAQVIAATDGVEPEWLDGFSFADDAVVVVSAGSRTTGGYGLEVTEVRRSGRDLEVDLRVLSPPPGAAVTTAFSEPYVALRVPQAELKGVTKVQVKAKI